MDLNQMPHKEMVQERGRQAEEAANPAYVRELLDDYWRDHAETHGLSFYSPAVAASGRILNAVHDRILSAAGLNIYAASKYVALAAFQRGDRIWRG